MMLLDPNDLTPANDDMGGRTGNAFTSSQLITMACQAVVNTTFTSPTTPAPDWFTSLNNELVVAQGLAQQWLDTLGQEVSQTIPTQVLDFTPTMQAVASQVADIVAAHPDAQGADNPYVVQIKEMIEQGLIGQINTSVNAIDDVATKLQTWGSAIQTAHNNLSTGSDSIQSAMTHLQSDIQAMNDAIANYRTLIASENNAIAISAAAIGLGIFALIAGIALAFVTFGAGVVVAVAGGAAIIGGAVTWGVMQARINDQYKDIAADQSELAADERQIVSLKGLELASGNVIDNLSTASDALSKLRTQWGVFGNELKGVVAKLEQAEDSISTIMQGVFTDAAMKEWTEAAATAEALINRKIEMDQKTLGMTSDQAVAA